MEGTGFVAEVAADVDEEDRLGIRYCAGEQLGGDGEGAVPRLYPFSSCGHVVVERFAVCGVLGHEVPQVHTVDMFEGGLLRRGRELVDLGLMQVGHQVRCDGEEEVITT